MNSAHPTDVQITTSRIGAADAAPALVLPGGPCRGPEYLEDLAGLGEVRALTVLHPRGTSQTGGLSRGWWQDADDVVTVADRLDQERIDLVAHSAGTRLALATATRHPDRVRSLLLITPPATWLSGTAYDGAEIAASRQEPEVTEAIASMERDDPQTEAEFRAAMLTQAPASYARWTATEQRHAAVGTMSLAAARAWFGDIPTDAVDRIRSVDLPPTLVIAGDADLLTGVQPVRDYAGALGAEFALLEDCGHYPWVEQPEAFRSVAETWLRS